MGPIPRFRLAVWILVAPPALMAAFLTWANSTTAKEQITLNERNGNPPVQIQQMARGWPLTFVSRPPSTSNWDVNPVRLSINLIVAAVIVIGTLQLSGAAAYVAYSVTGQFETRNRSVE